jgi:hypothetical protein
MDAIATYYCQGHATECPACRCPDGWCEGHGEVSYCDGTCTEAMLMLEDDIAARRVAAPADTTDSITLHVGGYGRTPESWFVTFEGSDAQAWALAYIEARPGFYFSELAYRPFSHVAFPQVADKLYPTCHHGMDANGCMDPLGEHHFGTREWEMAQGW